jgi:hypothetical protein
MAIGSRTTQSRLRRLSRQIEQWRLAGRPGKRMPAALWEAASELTEELGCCRVSRELGLNCADLRERAGTAVGEQEPCVRGSRATKRAERDRATATAFAELDLEAVLGSRQRQVQFDLWRPDGARMQIRVAAADGSGIATIVATFVGNGA